ncbi:hypothetical protein ILFOPFJJ_03346 [Ensifer psoraleae]|nr:hypothetical protein [Sinorhizobium psoraleae]
MKPEAGLQTRIQERARIQEWSEKMPNPRQPDPKPPSPQPPPPWNPEPPIEEPDPDRLPDEVPDPNPDENPEPPKHFQTRRNGWNN